ncbi:putative zinc-binding dehydrogenase protein [Coleophoma cylindrospora]|uniref:Putative zinc-binding dehydrogenase protein n=1 Tax=Coleophoma cylindrospora TaxID=1849047 RepID=A0A3D8RUH9_9HELO|nr:putative zinc-binding dehydrogenase protein [Coleophoma cylindrospora]
MVFSLSSVRDIRKIFTSSRGQKEDYLTPPKTPTSDDGNGTPQDIVAKQLFDTDDLRSEVSNAQVYLANRFEHFDIRHQQVLLLHAPKQPYIRTEYDVPLLCDEREMLVKIKAIGLNPIDWKAPDFGFGLPPLPCISGRDFAGIVVRQTGVKSRFEIGDAVIGISTDYRDTRKSAYQEYAVLSDFNACRIPKNVAIIAAAPIGVAFVASALALGICLGLGFGDTAQEPDILSLVREQPLDSLPKDVQFECFDHMEKNERPRAGDWIAIWGGSSATGCCAIQLAKLAGLKVVAIIDVARNGARMLKYGADILIDRYDTSRAVEIVKSITGGRIRFALDTRGKESSASLAQVLQSSEDGKRAHLVGLAGLPNEPVAGVVYHSVPIKIFHEAPVVGHALMLHLERLLDQGLIYTPDIELADGGLDGINAALDRLRNGSVNGPRIVVPLVHD